MKVVQINVTANAGSTGRISEEIGQLVIDNGWESFIIYGRKHNNSSSNIFQVGSSLDVFFHGVYTRLFDRHGLGSVYTTKKLVKKLCIIGPDIVHLHNIHGYFINYKILFDYLLNANIPVVWTLHDCWPFTGHCAHFELIKCERWKTGCFSCPKKSMYPKSCLFDRSKQNYIEKKKSFTSISKLFLVPVSEWLLNLVNQSFLKDNSTICIHNGININIFKPTFKDEITFAKKNYGIEHGFIILGVANVWTKQKGLLDFYKLSKIIGENISILLVGLKAEQITDLPANIIGIKRTENLKELVTIYGLADVFVNPTYEDNFPTTNLEAMACGTPVITYDTGGCKESISCNTGFVVEQGNIDGLINSILSVKKNTKQYYSDACRQRVEKFYNKDDRFYEYIKLYKYIYNSHSH